MKLTKVLFFLSLIPSIYSMEHELAEAEAMAEEVETEVANMTVADMEDGTFKDEGRMKEDRYAPFPLGAPPHNTQ